MQIKNYSEVSPHTNLNGHYKNPQTINARESMEKKETSCTVDGNGNWYSHCGEQYGDSLKKKKKTKKLGIKLL